MNNRMIDLIDETNISKTVPYSHDKDSFIPSLCNVMSDDNFMKFFDKYCNDCLDIKTTIMYMKLYQFIDREYEEKYKKKIELSQMKSIIHSVFTNSKMRAVVVNEATALFNDDTVSKYIKQNKIKTIK